MSKRFFRIAGAVALVLSMSVSLHAVAQDQISQEVAQQIQSIQSIKANFAPGQKKMDSGLAFGVLAARNDPRVGGFRSLIAPLSGSVRVAITGAVGPDLVNAIAGAGGTVEAQSVEFGKLIAWLPVGSLEPIAARSDVLSMRKPSRAHTNAGLVTSQGYVAHGAKQAVAAGWTGAGVKVGVLSDSATPSTVSALIATGDLPVGTTSLPGQDGSGLGEDEGTAMMEIIHDMAPNAQLLFATAFQSDVSFANNIVALANAGCKVIVDDVTYFEEGAFQDTIIARAVNQVVAGGVTYFSSAGNSGALTQGTSGTWEGDFLSGGPVGGVIAGAGETGLVHNFGGSGPPQNYDVLAAASPFDFYVMQWSDPFGASGNDYDLFLLNSTGTVLKGFSAASQTGTQDPIEEIDGAGSAPGDRLVVVLFSGNRRALRIDTVRGRLTIATAGSTFGHNAAASAITMAATYWGSAKSGAQRFMGGSSNPTETFSSDGPRKIFYNPDGSMIVGTTGAGSPLFGTNGGRTLQKPDLAAADGGSALTFGFNPFFGTSAAAPHAAAIAALVLQARPGYSVSQIKTAMTQTALDIMAPGVDRDAGFGITMALPAVQYSLTH